MGNNKDPMLEIYQLLGGGATKTLAQIIQERRKEMDDVSDNQIASILGISKTRIFKR